MNGGQRVTAKAQHEQELTDLLAARWEQVSRKLTDLAGAFPEDELESRPVAGIRTVGEVLRHVAFWNQYVADSLRNRKADDTANELPSAACPTKARILEVLKQSSEDVVRALHDRQARLDSKTAELLMPFMEHTSEHYGQLVVYARLKGIVPPASRT
jgi:uncharacterized damage-inducible protein DinB